MDKNTHYLEQELTDFFKADTEIWNFFQRHSLDGVWYWDLEEPDNLWVSPEYWHLLGMDPATKKHSPDEFTKVVFAEDRDKVMDNLERHFADASVPYEQVVRFVHADGSTIWVRCRGIAIRDEHGRAIRMLGAHNDLTLEKQALTQMAQAKAQTETALVELSKEKSRLSAALRKLKLVTESSSDGFWHWLDPNSDKLEWSDAFFTLLGYQAQQFEPSFSLFNSLLHPDDVAKTSAAISDAIATRATFDLEYRLKGKQGDYRWYRGRGRAYYNQQQEFVEMAGSISDIHHHKLLDLEVHEANERFDLATKGASVGIFDWYDVEADQAFVSDRFLQLLGIDRSKDIQSFQDFSNHVHPDDLADLVAHIEQALAGEVKFDTQYRVYHASLGYRWLRATGTVRAASDNSPLRMVGSVEDIDERKRLENQLSQSNTRYDLAVRGLSIGIWQWNIVTGQLYCSPRLKQILGLAEEAEVVFDDFAPLLHPEDQEPTFAVLNQHLNQQGKYDVEYRLRHSAGHYVWIKAMGQALWNDAGEPETMVGSLEDITLSKAAQLEREELIAELAKSNEFNNTILNSSTHLLIATDKNGLVTQFNAASESVLGYRAEEVEGKQTPALWHDESEVVARAKALSLELQQPVSPGFEVFVINAQRFGQDSNEWTFIRKDGSRFPVNLTVTCIRGDQGEITGYLGVIEDITERRQKDLELQRAREKAEVANIAKSRFLASMSHEIRTPMNGILGTLQLLDDELKQPSSKKLLKNALTSSYTLLTIVNDILDFSKIEANMLSLEKIEFSCRQLLDEVSSSVIFSAKQKGVDFVKEIADDLNDVWLGDPVRVKQVLTNLVSNAVKFTHQGKVTVAIYSEVNQGELEFVIVVKDTGIGMEQNAIDSLFERFTQADSSTTRKYGGTGLGMAISKNLVELMGGRIEVSSKIDLGTEFKVVLPLTPGQAKEYVPPVVEYSVPDLSGKKILVAEDNMVNQTIIKSILAKTKVELQIAENGLVVIEKFKAFDPDLILMDIQMPELDGIEACKIIRAEDKQVPIVALTANVMNEDVQTYLATGFNEHLAKPLQVDLFYQRLRDYFKLS